MTINSTVLVGRLTRDVELRATTSGQDVASFTIAVDGNGTAAQTLFMNCTAWGNQAKFISTYCKKGFLIGVEGRLQQRSYDRKDGTKATIIELVCSNVQNLQPKATSEDNGNRNSGISIDENDNNDDSSISFSDDDLPF